MWGKMQLLNIKTGGTYRYHWDLKDCGTVPAILWKDSG
jgi:hypothetical protein